MVFLRFPPCFSWKGFARFLQTAVAVNIADSQYIFFSQFITSLFMNIICELCLQLIVTYYRFIPEGYTSSIPKALKFLIMYRIVVIDTFLGVGLQKVYCQFRYLLSSFFLLDQFIPNFGNLLNLISYATTGYFRSYLLKFFLCIFSVPVCRFSSLRTTACLVCIYP